MSSRGSGYSGQLGYDGAHTEDQGEAQRAEFPSPGRRGVQQNLLVKASDEELMPMTA